MAASDVSAHRAVRVKLTELQREVARENDVVMDGRDIGTNVLPDTPYKFYLTASVEERARRRLLELAARGAAAGTLADVAREIEQRDYNDSHRAYMPLRQAEDALYIDSTGMTVEEVTETILRRVREVGGR